MNLCFYHILLKKKICLCTCLLIGCEMNMLPKYILWPIQHMVNDYGIIANNLPSGVKTCWPNVLLSENHDTLEEWEFKWHPRGEPILGVNIFLPYSLTRAAYGRACGNILYSFPCIEFLNKYGTSKDLIVKTLNLFVWHILLSLPVEDKWHVNIFVISQ